MRKLLAFTLLSFLFASAYAQAVEDKEYNRSSLYTLSVVHPGKALFDEIFNGVWDLPMPDKFNDHRLSLRIINAPDSKESEDMETDLEKFFDKNQIAKRMVSKWFNRDKETGAFDISLIAERGLYNASQNDIALAMNSIRGQAILSDAGEQLIPSTFVLVNDITYVNRDEGRQTASLIFSILAAATEVASAATGNMDALNFELTKSVDDLSTSISQSLIGFTVKINSYLYQLNWNDSVASVFYSDYYYDKDNIDKEKKAAFEKDNSLFKLTYLGKYKSTSGKTEHRGVHTDAELIHKVFARTIDKNMVELQKSFDAFKVVVPVYKVEGDKVFAQIGLKEGVSKDSKFEVIERVEDKDGNYSYKRRGVIKPIPERIWDNRFMAFEEGAKNSNLNYTTFEIVSGSGFYPGMLIRETKYASGM